jgi:hypothetical protein
MMGSRQGWVFLRISALQIRAEFREISALKLTGAWQHRGNAPIGDLQIL